MLDGLLSFLGANEKPNVPQKKDINFNELKDLSISMLKKPIVLVGMPSSGKTTIAKSLASTIGCSFIDIDNLIEQVSKKTISDIFNQDGEETFRLMEQDVLKQMIEKYKNSSVVISTGGGLFCNFNSIDIILKNAISFFIDVSPEEIINRLKTSEDKNQRPLLLGGELKMINTIYRLYNLRYDFYIRANYTINGDKTVDEIVTKIKGVLSFI